MDTKNVYYANESLRGFTRGKLYTLSPKDARPLKERGILRSFMSAVRDELIQMSDISKAKKLPKLKRKKHGNR